MIHLVYFNCETVSITLSGSESVYSGKLVVVYSLVNLPVI